MTSGISGGRYRIWGSGDFKHWFPLDIKRPKKSIAFILELDSRFRPVVTPQDPQLFRTTLESKGVHLEAGEYKD